MYPNLGWCSFDSIFDGNYGYCTDDCKTKKLAKPNGGTCQATSIDCPPIAFGTTRLGFGSNGTCVFPFLFDGEMNYKCKDSKIYAGVGWCSFDSNFGSGSMKTGRWGYCTSDCPKEYDDPCEGVVCDIPGEECKNGICKCGDACSCGETGYLSGTSYFYCDPINSKCKCSETEDACEDGKICDKVARRCLKCNGGDSCCTSDNLCDVGEGDCDSDADCKQGLKCGTANCQMAVSYGDLGKGKGICELGYLSAVGCGEWQPGDDCCYDPTLSRYTPVCEGGDSCCTDKFPCGLGEGDCDNDSDCKEGLKCGNDNCFKETNNKRVCLGDVDCDNFELDDDCCFKPELL